jgi:3-oxoacyl-[acyl-carrier protein] reductase
MPLEQIEKGLASMCPLGRCGTTSDIAKAVALLVSPDSEWINGKQPFLRVAVIYM